MTAAAAETVGEPTDVVGTLPKTLQTKESQLLSRLSAVAWNERGELMYEGVAIPGSNMVDLIHDPLRNRKNARSRQMAAVRQPNARRQHTHGTVRQRH